MTTIEKTCFIIMPFTPELNYFYLYLKQHIEHDFSIKCERADAQVLTISLLEKIQNYIATADVIIADCSNRNPNVMYELGIAHSLNKKVILITSDSISEAPSDIRHLEFIPYKLDNHSVFIEKLDNAVRNVFFDRYEKIYDIAKEIFDKFKKETSAPVNIASKEIFLSRAMSSESSQNFPNIENIAEVIEFVLPKIIENSTDATVMKKVTDWLTTEKSTALIKT